LPWLNVNEKEIFATLRARYRCTFDLKLMLAYMLLNYEFQTLPERPASKWIGTSLVPPLRATIQIRRRKQDSEL
jgi:hypothetical protein